MRRSRLQYMLFCFEPGVFASFAAVAGCREGWPGPGVFQDPSPSGSVRAVPPSWGWPHLRCMCAAPNTLSQQCSDCQLPLARCMPGLSSAHCPTASAVVVRNHQEQGQAGGRAAARPRCPCGTPAGPGCLAVIWLLSPPFSLDDRGQVPWRSPSLLPMRLCPCIPVLTTQ